ncbi:hypothetical protein [Empedobacter brevis]|uniref:hypothetical protein n=1 Tax=Empedobacter brevis TaxID=247 RepID=UPI0028B00FAA|nr:hypothetical protein [Empedobacter brevis]
MSLELKHISPYLPYELTGICTEEFSGIEKVIGISKYSNTDEVYLITSLDDLDIEYFKPIFRPLSDLTKEIEVDREKFVPIDAIKSMSDMPYSNSFRYEEGNFIFTEQRLISEYGSHSWLDFDHVASNQILFFEKLYEWHFDVFGLIEKGLAVDINTLNQEL